MRFKIYTPGEYKKRESRFTSEEHEQQTKRGDSREEIVRDFLAKDSRKLVALDYLIQFARAHGCTRILSMGAGTCVIESLLAAAMPPHTLIEAADFDWNYIVNATEAFPEIVPVQFDFFHHDTKNLPEFDLAYFLGSSYVMNGDEFVRILKGLRSRYVIDLTPTLVSIWCIPWAIAGEMKRSGKFHGYSGTRNEFRRVYRKAGWRIVQETKVGPYNYVAVLERRK